MAASFLFDIPLALLGTLVVLALVDSTSVGTLGIPALMLAPSRLRPAAVLVYLLTIASFYFAVGLLLLTGVTAGLEAVLPRIPQRVQAVAVVVLGVALFALSYAVAPSSPEAREAKRRRRAENPGPVQRALASVLGERATLRSVILLAVAAGVAELTMMVPYLGAISMIAASPLGAAGKVTVLGGYVLVMIAPAAVLFVARLALSRHIQPTLERVGAWVTRSADTTIGWVMGILGVVFVVNGVGWLVNG
ncbi:GAP family protein [Nigerium massiliense]|uniref:GAP family protein n=1 Tax=Nigerium massiliense TaxID=1522317 RepID=UPI00069472AC|nr:GAP family protein [Nigerium massiliense]